MISLGNVAIVYAIIDSILFTKLLFFVLNDILNDNTRTHTFEIKWRMRRQRVTSEIMSVVGKMCDADGFRLRLCERVTILIGRHCEYP